MSQLKYISENRNMSESGFIKKCIVKILTLAQETHFNEDQGLSDLLLLINKNQNTEQVKHAKFI